jgi:hypothetical protein
VASGRCDDVPERGDYERWRRSAKPKFEDIKLQVACRCRSRSGWIDFFKGVATTKTGAIVAADITTSARAAAQGR